VPKDRNPRRRPERKSHFKAQSRAARWQRFRWLLTAAPLALVAVATYLLINSSLFVVREVRVQGTHSLDHAALIEISRLQGENILRLPLNRARQQLLAVPQVKSVTFGRNWPHGVTVRVEERLPVAFWSVAGKDYVVDEDGVVLAGGAPDGPAPRIVEVGNDRTLAAGDRVHPDAIALARRIFKESPRFLGASVDLLEYRPAVGVTAVFQSGMRVTFGDERAYEYKVAVLAELLDHLSGQGKAPKTVDLRFGARVTYE
jgi:cell division protein FtsQ